MKCLVWRAILNDHLYLGISGSEAPKEAMEEAGAQRRQNPNPQLAAFASVGGCRQSGGPVELKRTRDCVAQEFRAWPGQSHAPMVPYKDREAQPPLEELHPATYGGLG